MKLARRTLVSGLSGAAALAPWRPRRLHAQPRATLRVGTVAVIGLTGGNYVNLRARMADLGYVEGRNFILDFVIVERPAEYVAAYADLVKGGADILLALGSELVLQGARQAAASHIPVIFLAVDYDPVQSGYVASLTRPGGNLTGFVVRQSELATKRVALAREALPNAKRLALWWDNASRLQVEAAAAAAKALGLEADLVGVSGQPPDYDAAFRLGERLRAEAVILTSSPAYFLARAEIARLALARRMPLVAAFREIANAGALLSYGIDLPGIFRDMATYIDRIAHGAKPADLPILQPTKFDLVINLKTAKGLGIAIPPSLRARTSDVIE